jgi:hypothetical protein
MVVTAGHRLTLDPMPQCGFPNSIKKTKFVEANQMNIPEKFGFNCPSGFSKEGF